MTERVRRGHGFGVMVKASFLLVLAACGSDPVVPVDAGGTDSGKQDSTIGFPDAGSDASDASDATCVPGVCPSTAPTNGEACSGDFFCEYGTAAAADCNTTAECVANAWQVTPPNPAGCTPNSQCPATIGAALDGGPTCGVANFTCYYLEGTCGCVNGGWGCIDGPNDPSCPVQRPRYGTACTGGATCGYGAACPPLSGNSVQCVCGRWQAPPPPSCPPP